MRAVIVPGENAGWARIRVSGNVDIPDDGRFVFAIKRANTLSSWLGPVGWQAAETWFGKAVTSRVSGGEFEVPIGPEIVDQLEIGNYEFLVKTSDGKMHRTVISCGRLATSGARTGTRAPRDAEEDSIVPSAGPIASESGPIAGEAEGGYGKAGQAPSPANSDTAGAGQPEDATGSRRGPLLWGALGVVGAGVVAAAVYLGGAGAGRDSEQPRAPAPDASPAVSVLPMSGSDAVPGDASPHEEDRATGPSGSGPSSPTTAPLAEDGANDHTVAKIVGIQAARDYVGTNPPPKSAYMQGEALLAEGRKGEAYVLLKYAADNKVAGVADAAIALGRMYDPASIGVQSMFEPSKKTALEWYKRAEELGDVDAARRIRELQEER